VAENLFPTFDAINGPEIQPPSVDVMVMPFLNISFFFFLAEANGLAVA
jgi:hypothetical protein